MDPRTRAAQPTHQENQPPARPAPAPVSANNSRFFGNRFLIVLLIILSLLGIGFLVAHFTSALTADAPIKSKEYQALFLTNGQVYFGHLSKVDASYVELKDIYYLQVQQTVQPKDASQAAQQSVSLAKLGGELHAPEDVMYVSRAQVLFWENLKTSGQVTQAIVKYKAGGK